MYRLGRPLAPCRSANAHLLSPCLASAFLPTSLPMPAGLLARVTSNLYREKAAQLQQQQQSSPSSESPSPSPPKEIVAVDFAQPKLPAAAYLDESSSSSYADPYATSPTLVLPDPADTLQFQALAIDRPPSPSVAQPAPAAYSASVKQQQQMRCVGALRACAPARPPARARPRAAALAREVSA